jgi:hypothetical protein
MTMKRFHGTTLGLNQAIAVAVVRRFVAFGAGRIPSGRRVGRGVVSIFSSGIEGGFRA